MTQARKPGITRRVQQPRAHRSSQVATLRRRIGEELESTESVVRALSRDLAAYRRDNRELSRDHERLKERLAHLDVARLEQADTETLWRASLRERQHVEDRLRALEAQNQRLVEECAALERALAAERERSELAGMEVECLEEQIAELESIIALLTPEADEGTDS